MTRANVPRSCCSTVDRRGVPIFSLDIFLFFLFFFGDFDFGDFFLDFDFDDFGDFFVDEALESRSLVAADSLRELLFGLLAVSLPVSAPATTKISDGVGVEASTQRTVVKDDSREKQHP